jgi:hypothetical protein
MEKNSQQIVLPAYGVGAKAKPTEGIDWAKLALESKPVPRKKDWQETAADAIAGTIDTGAKAITGLMGGVWNRLTTPSPVKGTVVMPQIAPPTPTEWEALKAVAPGDRTQMLELLRATGGQQK